MSPCVRGRRRRARTSEGDDEASDSSGLHNRLKIQHAGP